MLLIEKYLSSNESGSAIILTPHIDILRSMLGASYIDRVVLKSVSMHEVNDYLNAADFAVFLRRNNPVNRVASPVKFCEYSLSGLPIIMGDAVKQAFSYAEKLGNMIHYRFGSELTLPPKTSDLRRQEISNEAKMHLSRSAVIGKYASIYQSQL